MGKNGVVKQALNNLPDVEKDCDEFKKCLHKYAIKRDNIIDLSNDPSSEKVKTEFDKLSKRMRAGKKSEPAERFFVICLFAGHGLIKDAN